MEIKLNREEVLCLIRKMGGVAIRLRNTSIHAVVTNQKYVNFLTELSIDDLKYVAGNYIRSVANLFDYEGVIEYDFAFDSIIIAAKATILKNSYIESAVIDETETFIDDRWIEDDNEIDREIDEEEERERKEMEELETYEEQVRESDEINYEIQAEMEQYMFENGKDYEDYQEPQLYDTEEDEEQAQYSSENTTEDALIDSLNNDLDDCLSKEWFLVEHIFTTHFRSNNCSRESVVKHIAVFNWKPNK